MENKKYCLKDLERNPDLLLKTQQVKSLIRVSDATMYRWRRNGIVKCYKIGGTYRYKAGEVLKIILNLKLET